MPSFYVPSLVKTDAEVIIKGDEFHHIKNVFRKQTGDEILLTNGNGILAKAEISEIFKTEIIVNILSVNKLNFSEQKIAIAFPFLKNKHDNLIVEKLTELGVKDFFPIITKRTVQKPKPIEKFEKITISAIKQCDNVFLPKVHQTVKLSQFFKTLQTENYQPVVALETEKEKLLSDVVSITNICIIIGPEGGFSEEEIAFIKEQNIPTFKLGNHILRAETAAISAVSQLVSIYLKNNNNFY